MNPEKWQKIKELFNQAVEMSPTECEIFLQNLADAEIRSEVLKLIEAEKQNNFAEPVANLSNLWREGFAENYIGKEICGYKIIREIGHGGMGIVFEAVRQKDDFSQTVALKLLKKGMDSDAMLRRFSNERQILASLEHPNIARLLDGGRSEEGTPFFAMEFVNGIPFNEFCNEKDLSISQRLRLFLQVCSVVSFAHSRLVVHRDLKPSNILVTADGIVKLLDFGISKVISNEADYKTQTVTSLGMMTPKYASPEQISGQIVSTSSDIYSLGLILYELLTGVSAYNFPNNRPDEIAKIICEREPQRPSSVVSGQWSVTSENTDSNHGQSTNPKSKITNPKSLRGDLDNILLKALQKLPARRYASVEQFANDIQRHLEGLPVIARPDTFSYRLEKFVKRNRVYVMTGTLLFITLIAGVAATSWQAYRAEKQRKLAEERFNQVRELANNIVFKYYDEAEKLPNSTPIREMFVKDSLAYFDSLSQDSNADDLLKSELGRAFLRIARVQGRPSSPNLGQTSQAIENYRKGIEILEPIILKSSDTTLQAEFLVANADYAVVLRQNGRIEESNKFYQKAISIGEEFLRLNPENEMIASRLAVSYLFWGNSLPVGFAENENIWAYKKVIGICEKLLQKNPNDLRLNNYLIGAADSKATALLALAKSAQFDENFELEKKYLAEAKSLLERNIEISKKLVHLYPNQVLPPATLAAAELSYATVLIETEEYEKALPILQSSEKIYRKSLEMDKVSVGQKLEVSTVEQRLGTIYSRTGKANQADSLFGSSFKYLDYLVEKDAENFDFIKTRGEAKFNYGDELLRRGESEKARQVFQKAFDEMFETANKKDTTYAKSLQALYF
ncbi:MAG TPA: serine/threonine-protein kinase, partial [Pyrinomonadaceae bacterium]|nr:serine/threonine-protein kinase [Pyrinomonadaceae bacterium]